ncbi:RNA polymerase sigma factor [uncultured Roseibium sp.]|uniref:RNA polymerase sigma factor n=1 Tax=uncultured Roseibium sp. TaxID=1936171 RepID=UPI0026284D98|nr:RNA polymerase sigma factor [uncultured Roseibium sp.]
MCDGLIKKAKKGDRQAFTELLSAELPKLRRIVRRLIGHPEDSEDILQETVTKAWTRITTFEEKSLFSTWVTSIATRAAVDHLRTQKRWRTEAQVAYANLCASSQDLSGEVMTALSDPEFSYDVQQHVAYCFTCVGRSLPADEQAALVLRDVLDLSSREASTVLGVSDSVLRHRLSAARTAMQDKFEGLCALVNKKGICHQCAGLKMAAGATGAKTLFPEIDDFADRMAVVRAAEPGTMSSLHDIFWRRTKQIEDAGEGSVEPLSGCGENEDASKA